jgi:glyoxylase-like metal-dependent hydrolase (beta-lactamase superfamily II)
MTRQFDAGPHEVAEGIFAYLQPPGGWGQSNAGFITGADRSLLVETFSDLDHTQRMLDAMRAASPGAGDIKTVVNTHSDPDHCWGNQLLAGQAEIIATRDAAEAMLELQPALLQTLKQHTPPGTAAGDFAELMFGAFDFSRVVVTPPTRTFEGELTLTVGEREIELTQVGPAHTRGDALLHIPDAGVLFTGDIVFAGAHPLMWHGPVDRWIEACEHVIALNPAVIVPGHGPLSTVSAVCDVRDYLSYVRDQSRVRYDGGMSAVDAAYDIDLNSYSGWIDQERIIVTVDSLYREFSDATTTPNQPELIGKMAQYRASHRP